jgi:hypothetical protein
VDERRAITQHVMGIKSKLDQYKAANTTVVKQTPTSVTIQLPGNPQALKDELKADFVSDIGPDRGEVLSEYSDGPVFNSLWQRSGKGTTTQNRLDDAGRKAELLNSNRLHELRWPAPRIVVNDGQFDTRRIREIPACQIGH